MKKKEYKKELYHLQVQLVKFQKHLIEKDKKVCVIFEGRDTAGKDGIIKRFTEHLSSRDCRSVALGVPSDIEKKSWYFQRYVNHLPHGGEIVFFNRSWYNRAGVEKVMHFCTPKQHKLFLEEVGNFEHLLVQSDIIFYKYYLDISKKEQEKRLKGRKVNPLKQWKLSPIDQKASNLWDAYTRARNEMFLKTNFAFAPWIVVHSDNKKEARINGIKHFLSRVEYPGKDQTLLVYDNKVILEMNPENINQCFY